MLTISILSVFPQLHEQFLSHSIIGKAQEKGLLRFNLVKFSDFVPVKSRIDEPICGPGAGMLIKPTVIQDALEQVIGQYGPGFTVFFSPQGIKLNQPILKTLSDKLFVSPDISAPAGADKHIILVCPRYEGMDARVEATYADLVVSIGDYVLMGGDLPAQVFLEGLLRYYPGVVGKSESVEEDSFSGPFLDHPAYGLPATWQEQPIPEMVRSGNHEAIRQWRLDAACQQTLIKRFDWFTQAQPNTDARKRALKAIPPHYVVLMHDQIKIAPPGSRGTTSTEPCAIGTTSVTSIDVHDTARSCATYGIKNFFIVTPLVDQLAIVHKFLEFWQTETGKQYNRKRYDAVSRVRTAVSLAAVCADIEAQTGKKPLIVTTSARSLTELGLIPAHTLRQASTVAKAMVDRQGEPVEPFEQAPQEIDFFSQGQVWQHDRPVLFMFGTGQGLADQLITSSDYLLTPVTGITDYNHLSVRSAMAIVLDRWLGLNPAFSHKNSIAKSSD